MAAAILGEAADLQPACKDQLVCNVCSIGRDPVEVADHRTAAAATAQQPAAEEEAIRSRPAESDVAGPQSQSIAAAFVLQAVAVFAAEKGVRTDAAL